MVSDYIVALWWDGEIELHGVFASLCGTTFTQFEEMLKDRLDWFEGKPNGEYKCELQWDLGETQAGSNPADIYTIPAAYWIDEITPLDVELVDEAKS